MYVPQREVGRFRTGVAALCTDTEDRRTTVVLPEGTSVALPEHWLFSFTPATSAQSRVFLSSPSVRATFTALARSVASPLCLLDVEESHKIVVTARDRRVSTRVPGPCVLWDRRAPADQAYGELLARLAGQPAAPRWILGPEHPDYRAFVDTLARNSRVTGAVS